MRENRRMSSERDTLTADLIDAGRHLVGQGLVQASGGNLSVRLPGTEHWTSKGDVKLFLWNKVAEDPAKTRGTILFVHG